MKRIQHLYAFVREYGVLDDTRLVVFNNGKHYDIGFLPFKNRLFHAETDVLTLPIANYGVQPTPLRNLRRYIAEYATSTAELKIQLFGGPVAPIKDFQFSCIEDDGIMQEKRLILVSS